MSSGGHVASSLKESLAATPAGFGVVYGLVRHFVPVTGAGTEFWERMTVRYSPGAAANNPVSPLRPYHKVAHRADPTVIVHRGNHELHRSCHRVLRGWFPIEVLHFPIRTAEQAKLKYLTWAGVFGDDARGTHLTTAHAAREGTLDAHAATYLTADEVVNRGLRDGVLERDTRLRDVLRALTLRKDGARGLSVISEPGPPQFPGSPAQSYLRDSRSNLDAHAVRVGRRLDQLDRRAAMIERG